MQVIMPQKFPAWHNWSALLAKLSLRPILEAQAAKLLSTAFAFVVCSLESCRWFCRLGRGVETNSM